VALPVLARSMYVRVTSGAVRIRPAQPVQDSRLAQEWAERQDCLLQECRPSRQDARDRNRAVRDSDISTGLKKVR
jgi:hypothetical protein